MTQLRETMRGFEVERGAGFRTILDELNIRAELADAEVAAAIVMTERDGQSLQLAAAAALLDLGSSVPAGRRFEAIAPMAAAPRLAERRPASAGVSAKGGATFAPVLRGSVPAEPSARASVLRLSQAEPDPDTMPLRP